MATTSSAKAEAPFVERVVQDWLDHMAQRDLSISYECLGDTRKALGEFDEAGVAYRSGAAVLIRMIEQGMDVAESKSKLATLESAAESAEQAPTALGSWDDLLQQPAEKLPALLEFRGIELGKRGRMVEAAEAVTKLRELPNVTSDQLYNAGCVFSLCAASIKAPDGKPLDAEQDARRQAWINDALAALKQAITAGWTDFAHMQQDPDLGPLRDLPEFKQLIPTTPPTDPSFNP